MGKRELLLIIGFVIVGMVVYHATAPPPGPDDRGLSISRFVAAARREIHGNRGSADLTSTSIDPVSDEVSELRVMDAVAEVRIQGEDRSDVEATLQVHSNAYDEAEAKKLAGETTLKKDFQAGAIVYRVRYPQPGRQRATLSLRVPERLRARIEAHPGRIVIDNVAGVELTNAGGETKISKVAGRVAITQRGGSLVVDDAGTLKFNGRGTELTLAGVRGEATVMLEQGGELKGTRLAGPLDIEARNADITLHDLESTRGLLRVNATNGTVRLAGLKTEARIDGRNTDLEVAVAAPAPIAIYNEGEDITLSPPPGGYRLDAVVVEGEIAPEPLLSELGLQVTAEDAVKESRASGNVNGGGPTITVRATRGDLTIRGDNAKQ